MPAAAPGPIVLWLSSRYENIELAQAALAHVCRIRGIDAEMEHWIGMAMREAVANAVKHGNRLDPDKRVLVRLESAGHDPTIGAGGEGGEPGPVAEARNRVDALDRRKETIVYGHDAAAAQRVADWLRAQGFRQVRVYADAWQVWGNSLELPVAGERYADVGALRDRLVSLERELARLSPRAALSEAGASRPEALSASR